MEMDSKDEEQQVEQSYKCHQDNPDADSEKTCTEDQPARSGFKDRIIRAAKLDISLYKEVAEDTGTMNQAIAIVLLSAIAVSIGKIGIRGPGQIIVEPISAIIGWYMWTYIIYFVGTKFFPEAETNVTPGALLRATGFSHAPGIIRIICIVPGIFNTIFVVGSSWMLVAMVIAVRQTFNYKSTLRAIGVCAIGWVIKTLIFMTFAYLANNSSQPI